MEATYAEPSPYPQRPGISGLAITGFVLSLVLAFVSMIGIWWLNVVPLLFIIPGWMAISGGRKRGLGFAIAGLVISVLAAVGVYLMWRAVATVFEAGVNKFLTAVDQAQDAELEHWVPKGEEGQETVERWKERMTTARAETGAYKGDVTLSSGLWGPLFSMMMTPKGAKEVVTGSSPPTLSEGSAWLWFQASFEKGRFWVALEISGEERQRLKGSAEGTRIAIFRDVRFFRRGD